MTYKERLKLLQELKKQPLNISSEKPEQVEEALNWAIKICHKFVSRQKVKKHGLGGYCKKERKEEENNVRKFHQ